MEPRIRVLLVDDNPADARMTELVLKESALQHSLTVVSDGSEALAFLYQDPPYTGVPPPDLILLDLHLPKVDGVAVLQAIKNLRGHGRIIKAVIVLTGLQDPIHREAALALGADACFAKPQDVEELHALASSVREVWERVSGE